MLIQFLLTDLERQYFYRGLPSKKATRMGLVANMLSPRFIPVILCRMAHALYRKHITPLARLMSLFNFVFFGIEIGLECEFGQGLYFPHTSGTVIGAARIGRNAVIYHGVTLGAKDIDIAYRLEERPVVGDNVVIGSGAKVLGGITLGNNVKVGANAVVLNSFPDNVILGGIPAKIVRHLESISA